MGVTKVEVVTCDECGNKVENSTEDVWIDATYFGVAFHVGCFKEMSALQLLKRCNIDTVLVRNYPTGEYAKVYVYAMNPEDL